MIKIDTEITRTTREYAPAWCHEVYAVAGGLTIVRDTSGKYWRASRGLVTVLEDGQKPRVDDAFIFEYGPCKTLDTCVK